MVIYYRSRHFTRSQRLGPKSTKKKWFGSNGKGDFTLLGLFIDNHGSWFRFMSTPKPNQILVEPNFYSSTSLCITFPLTQCTDYSSLCFVSTSDTIQKKIFSIYKPELQNQAVYKLELHNQVN